MQASGASLPEISFYTAKINSISEKETVNVKWLVTCLVGLVESGVESSDKIVRVLLKKIFEPKITKKTVTVGGPFSSSNSLA